MNSYIGSQQHWEDSINARYDERERMNKEQVDNRVQEDDRVQCEYCQGDGFTAEHDPNDPHEFGCTGGCPIQVPCHHCEGTGVLKGSA